MPLKLLATMVVLAAFVVVSPSRGAELPNGSLLVSISISPDKKLVGLPAAIRIEVLNPTQKGLEMPTYVALAGRYAPTGDRFIVQGLSSRRALQVPLLLAPLHRQRHLQRLYDASGDPEPHVNHRRVADGTRLELRHDSRGHPG